MTIRWKLNLAFLALLVVFLLASWFSMTAVTENAENTRTYSRMRAMGQLTSDIRTDIFQRLAVVGGSLSPLTDIDGLGWPQYVLDDIDVQVRLSETQKERYDWQALRRSVVELSGILDEPASRDEIEQALRGTDKPLRELRNLYGLAEADAIADSARTSLTAQFAIWLACPLTVALFLGYLVMVRDWLVKPIRVLQTSADKIGEGKLDYRVPLTGKDELAQLARRIDAMAERLAQHQAELLEARELSAIGELCANVAHGLRNPLASIRASAQLAGRRARGSTRIQEAVEEIMQRADRMDERITQLFAFSRPMELNLDCTTFAELAAAARAEAADLLGPRRVKLKIDDQTGDTVWCLDREQIACALGELVTNAVHHSAEGDEITILGTTVSPSNGLAEHIRIDVIDQGSGLPKATLSKAFDLFFTSRPDGTGMGLAMVRRAVGRHGGEVSLTSEPGEGTTARVTLPGRCPFVDDPERVEQCALHLKALKKRTESTTITR